MNCVPLVICQPILVPHQKVAIQNPLIVGVFKHLNIWNWSSQIFEC